MSKRPLRNCEIINVNGSPMRVDAARRANYLQPNAGVIISLLNGKDLIIQYDNVYEVYK